MKENLKKLTVQLEQESSLDNVEDMQSASPGLLYKFRDRVDWVEVVKEVKYLNVLCRGVNQPVFSQKKNNEKMQLLYFYISHQQK